MRTIQKGGTKWNATAWKLSAIAILCTTALTLDRGPLQAAPPEGGTVPPTMEIEVLDPGVDPLGKPAVLLEPGTAGQMQVDIPPVVLVHRYYYSGNRSFQAQLLPGGPSIIVANHPRTGERCYVPVQMMPGAPRVTYDQRSIEYDYGEHGTTIIFGRLGPPKVQYRSGVPWHRKIGNVVHAEQWHERAEQFRETAALTAERSKMMAQGAMAEMSDTAEYILLPAQNLLHMMPFGKMLFATEWDRRLMERAAEHEREKELHHAQWEAKYEDITVPAFP